jgi:PHP family Zn ribbon phosphoesterase
LEDKLNKAKDTPLYCREFKQYSNRLLEIIKKGIYDDVIISLVKSDEDLWQSLSRAYTELIETISEASLEDVFIINENIKEYIKQKNESIKNS